MKPRPLARLRGALLRWDRLLIAVSLALPFLVPFLLGFLWLTEHEWLLPYLGVSVGIAALAYGMRWFARRRPGGGANRSVLMDEMQVESDPVWSDTERASFRAARTRIERETAEPVAWGELPDLALSVIDDIAKGMGQEDRKALDFTLPEALLLTERAASRYRDHLRRHVPFSDRISLHTIHWIWKHRGRAQLAMDAAFAGHRVLRFALNPAKGVLREVEWLMAGGNTSYLGSQMMGVLQAVLLEEVAHAAVELYSGRLRFSDAELLQFQLDETRADRARLAQPDAPLRVLVLGQVSAGKSTLINALLGEDRTETDMAATTDGTIAYEAAIDGTDCLLLDTRGLDGGARRQAALVEEMSQSDIVLWVLRANRPGRAADKALFDAFEAWFAEHPDRRRPPVLLVATAVDRLAPDWPYPEHQMPKQIRERIGAAMDAIADDMGGQRPRPVSALEPDWNLDAVRSALSGAVSEGLLVQRNRLRLAAARHARSGDAQITRSGRGLWHGAKLVGGKLLDRWGGNENARPEAGRKEASKKVEPPKDHSP
ncbi:GTPase family protein [Limimaricola sp.]|uniref:GTPase family protein n=1 Tax=Limimaricola sp. TaxID=2211665 RepID=UPI004058241B